MSEETNLSIRAELLAVAGVDPTELAALSDVAGVDLDAEAADHLDAAAAEIDRITRATIRMGLHLLAAQASIPRGEFVRTIEERGFPRQRAYEAIKIVRMLLAAAAAPAEKSANSARADKSVDACRPRLQRLIAMGPARLEALSRLDPEVIESADVDLLDDVEAMPVQMLRSEVRRLRRKNQDLSARADKSETALREATAGDLENDEHVRTLEQRRKLRAWFSAAVRHAGPPDGSMDTIVVGTVLHHDSLLAGLLASASWQTRKFAAIEQWPDRMDLWDRFAEIATEEGDAAARTFYDSKKSAMDAGAKTSWPAARALIDIMLARAEDPVSFATEQQNSPAASPDAVFSGSLQYWSSLPPDMIFFGSVDPSLGKAGGGSDPSAVLVGGLDRAVRGRRALYILEARIGRRKPAEIIALIIDLQRQYQCFVWAVETIQFQEFFRDRLIEKSTEDGVPVPAVAVQPHTDKRLRIESLQPHIDNGLILFNRQHKTLIDHLEHYPHVAHDDGPDALHMLWSIAVSRGMAAGAAVRSRPRPGEDRIDWRAYA